ncbi:MAG: hypothetical protein U5K74_16215 [Gemmatimonadaceae bacterium]|nr:hypothetical protein [Gemmatimonadaceae bacterium]
MLLRVMQLAERRQAVNQVWSPRARDLFNRVGWGTAFQVIPTLAFTAVGGRFGLIRGGEFPPGYVVTPEMVGFGLPHFGFGLPHYGYNGGFTWGGWSH